MATGTNKPLGSTDPRDLAANAENLEAAVNDIVSLEWTDRFGRKRVTMHAVETAVPDAIAARDRAEAAAAIAQLAGNATPYATKAEMDAIVPAQDAWAVVLSDPDPAANGYYIGQGGVWVWSELQPAKAADVRGLQELISPSGVAEPIEAVVDDEGGIHRLHTPTMIEDSVHRVEEIPNAAAILGEDGGIILYQDEKRTIVGPLEVGHTDEPGVYVVDEEGGVYATLAGDAENAQIPVVASPLAGGAYFSGALVGAKGVPINVHVPSLIAERLRGAEVIATLNSTTAPIAISGSGTLSVLPESLGSSAQMVLRNRSNPTDLMVRALSVKTVPVPAVAPTPIRVLYIGDSIGNRQGLQFVADSLAGWGYLTEWVGTMHSSGVPSNANDVTGPLGECREGWETGDYTRTLTERGVDIAPGGEAEYMAMPKSEKWLRNPFIRAATESDAADDVRNGLVMDFAFYQSRFGLQAPDVVVWAMGTNDVRDRTEAEIYGVVSGNDALLYRRIKAAWPAAKIIRTVPGTAMDPSREPLWTSKYIPMLRAILDATVGVAGLTVAPAWAMANQDAAYSFAAAPDPTTGFTSIAGWSDAVHPVGALRIALHQALAPYIAAAGINLI